MLYLKEANFADIEQEFLFIREIPEEENSFTNIWHGIAREDFDGALQQMIDFSQGRSLPEGYVPETYLFLWDDEQIVGQFRIRHHLCDSLREGAGHIGYCIGKDFRGRGYGTEGLRLTLKKARTIIPEEEIYLRVDKFNTPSLKMMLHNGGRIAREDEKKYYVRVKV